LKGMISAIAKKDLMAFYQAREATFFPIRTIL